MASNEGSFWLPPQSSTVASEVDELFDFIMDLNYIFFFIILAMTVYFVVKYKRTSDEQLATSDLDHSTLWEGAWAFIPLGLCFVMFVWGFKLFVNLQVAPPGAMEVYVSAQKWSWNFAYENGGNSNDLYVPAGKPVKLIMKSKDVLHSFYVPDFRVKADVIPNRYTTVWFEAPEAGEHRIYCTEYCGKEHSGMYRTVHVLPPAEFEKKLEDLSGPSKLPEGMTMAQWGEQLYTEYTCVTCHSKDGSRLVGPSFKAIYGREGKLADGSTYKAAEEYINESIMEPKAKVVEGYPPAMPSFKGQLDDNQINAIIAFMKTLK